MYGFFFLFYGIVYNFVNLMHLFELENSPLSQRNQALYRNPGILESKVFAILKPNKDASGPNIYRPISLSLFTMYRHFSRGCSLPGYSHQQRNPYLQCRLGSDQTQNTVTEFWRLQPMWKTVFSIKIDRVQFSWTCLKDRDTV